MDNSELSTKPRELSIWDPVPIWDGFPPDEEALSDFAFSASHHRASERGRMAVAAQEYGPLAADDEGGY